MRRRDAAERDLDAVRSPEPEDLEDREDVALHRLGVVARSLTDEDHDLHEPPPGLWVRISEAVTPTTRSRGAAGAEGDEPAGDRADTVARPARWWRSLPWLAAAATVLVVAGIVGTIVLAGGGEEPAIVASADLRPLVDVPGSSARLVQANGRLALDVEADAAALPEPDGYYEVWLIDERIEGMISLGPMRADGTYAVPDGVDHHDFPVVDVSIEPDDGDPTHSGSSILRGTFDS